MSRHSVQGALMHELSVARGIVEVGCQALAESEVAGARVRHVRIRVGMLSGVVAEALEFCYELSARGTALEGSRLLIESQPVVVFCPRCLEPRVLADPPRFRCPDCGTPTPELVHGRELELISLELCDPDEPNPDIPDPRRDEPIPPDPGGPPGDPQGQ